MGPRAYTRPVAMVVDKEQCWLHVRRGVYKTCVQGRIKGMVLVRYEERLWTRSGALQKEGRVQDMWRESRITKW